MIYTKRGGITGSPLDNSQSKILKDMTLKGYDKEKTFKNVMMILIPKAFPKTVAVPCIGILIYLIRRKKLQKLISTTTMMQKVLK